MGMTLFPVNKSVEELEYNWGAWRFLLNCLDDWGVDTKEFSGYNDGGILSVETCHAVANAIEENLKELSSEDEAWLRDHIDSWHLSGGFEQW